MIEVTVDTAALSKLIDDLGEGFDVASRSPVEAMAQEILDRWSGSASARRYRRAERIRPRRGTSGRGGASGEPGGRRIMPGPDWPGWRPEQRPLIGPPK